MSSTFGTYNTAYSGMYVSQAMLTATSNNLSNVSTTGASRVRVSTTDDSISQSNQNLLTRGTSVASITRARDALLDSSYRTESADSNYWSVKNGNLEYMQNLLSEFTASSSSDSSTSSDGLQALITDYFDSWSELAKDTTSTSNRQAVLEAASSLISGLSEVDSQLEKLQQDAVNSVSDGVDSINNLASKISALNLEISKAETGGDQASYLRDQRDELLDEMSALADIKVTDTTAGLKVTIGGSTLLEGTTVHKLTASGDGSTANPLTVTWEETGKKADIESGSVKAYLEDADQSGITAISSLPYNFTASSASSISNMRQALNDLVTTIAKNTNSLHSTGYGTDGTTGLDFFTVVDSSLPLSISNIQVNSALSDDPEKIAAASTNIASGDNTLAEKIYELSSSENFQFDGLAGSVSDFYESFTSWIGTTGSDASTSYETQAALASQVDTLRQSVSGISTDEEMSNLIKFQNAYSASAKVLSTIDGLIAGLIQDLG